MRSSGDLLAAGRRSESGTEQISGSCVDVATYVDRDPDRSGIVVLAPSGPVGCLIAEIPASAAGW
jgi:hypothetical protein